MLASLIFTWSYLLIVVVYACTACENQTLSYPMQLQGILQMQKEEWQEGEIPASQALIWQGAGVMANYN